MRNKINAQFSDMLQRGTIPMIEIETTLGWLVIDIDRDAYGINFDYSFEEEYNYENKPYFDGTIQKRKGIYYVSWAEIDRSFYNLDEILQFIYENVIDGIVSAYNLHK